MHIIDGAPASEEEQAVQCSRNQSQGAILAMKRLNFLSVGTWVGDQVCEWQTDDSKLVPRSLTCKNGSLHASQIFFAFPAIAAVFE